MKLQTTQTEHAIEQIVSLIKQGVEAWVKAGKLVASAVDDDPDFIDKVCAKFPDISPEVMLRFDQIGRNRLYPKLLLSQSPGVKKLFGLPYALQERYCEKPVELLISEGDSTKTLQVDVRNLTSDQARQVFDKSGVRSLAAQRAWLESQRRNRIIVESDEESKYVISGKRIILKKDTSFTARELARILSEIE
jgi:hypothetical protein